MKDNNLGSTLMYRYINLISILQDYEGINQQTKNRFSIRVLPFKRVNKENVNELYRKIKVIDPKKHTKMHKLLLFI
jgi:hypothetical protein